ncbi:unnamed protein product [Ranitomeya imitator]|uniref:Protein kinase domain-containing protein n=1 Tax=Ranitomeya imitator TaxID=111125 RepID=A0ABN9MM20_9NEOB|nr:unnamed protein product [Ranitomeya imitator]
MNRKRTLELWKGKCNYSIYNNNWIASPSKSSHQPPSDPPQSLPSFTPYVDEMVLQQTVMRTFTFLFAYSIRFLRFAIQEQHYQVTALPFGLASAPRVFAKCQPPSDSSIHPWLPVSPNEGSKKEILRTPCKINSSVSSVLSSRKPGKEEDPLQRLQSSSQGKEEMVMYCKSKIYAGVDEFSLEEIRAEIYIAKIRKKREEDLQASALRRQEMERQIEEMEKRLKERGLTNPETVAEQDVPSGQSFKIYCDEEVAVAPGSTEVETASAQRTITAAPLPRQVDEILMVAHNRLASDDSPSAHTSAVQFTIFDETHEAEPDTSQNSMPPPKRRPLAPVTRVLGIPGDARRTDSIDDIEPLSEEAILTGSGGNKTLFADPEDTCEFMKAAQLASTPFQKAKDEPKQTDTSSQDRMPLREKMPASEESYIQVVCPNKLSPILEASQEDTRSSVSSVSSVSAGSSSLLSSKTLIMQEKPDLVSQISGVYEQSLVPVSGHVPRLQLPALTERRQCGKLTARDMTRHQEYEAAVLLGITELQRSILEAMPEVLASEAIIREAGLVPAMKDQQEVLLGNDSYCLKSEVILGENSSLHMGTQAGCDMVDLKGVVLKDILQDSEALVEQVAVLLAYNLLSLIEKLHTAEIVHGDLRPETLMLDVGIFFTLPSCTEMSNCLKPIDFSHSMDMRLCPTLTTRAFPIAQTEHGQQILSPQTSPYQVDLLGIANIVHLMIFKDPLHLQQINSSWKITRQIPRWWNENLWNTFFSKILSSSHGSTANVLKELKDQMAQLFDSHLEEEVCRYFIQFETLHNPL